MSDLGTSDGGPAERIARVALSRLAEPGDTKLGALVAELGAITVFAHLREENDLDGVYGDVAQRLRDLRPERDLEDADRRGYRFVVPGDAEWPASLFDLQGVEPVQRRGGVPLGLWLRGPLRLDDACRRAVAVVGSRSATSYGAEVATEIGATLAASGVTVMSGAAFGIDQAAHRGALAGRGATVAVLACGVDRAYPAAHQQLLDYVADVGLVVSELPPGCAPTQLRFLSRNRLIAALTVGTVVVEAALRSGALNTANWASRLHRVLMGVPGPVTSAPSQGVHELIRTGSAVLVTRGQDVLELVSPVGSMALPPARGEARPRDGLGEHELRVLDALPTTQPAAAAALSRTSGLAEATVSASLRVLEERGLADHLEGRWRLRRASSRGEDARHTTG